MFSGGLSVSPSPGSPVQLGSQPQAGSCKLQEGSSTRGQLRSGRDCADGARTSHSCDPSRTPPPSRAHPPPPAVGTVGALQSHTCHAHQESCLQLICGLVLCIIPVHQRPKLYVRAVSMSCSSTSPVSSVSGNLDKGTVGFRLVWGFYLTGCS